MGCGASAVDDERFVPSEGASPQMLSGSVNGSSRRSHVVRDVDAAIEARRHLLEQCRMVPHRRPPVGAASTGGGSNGHTSTNRMAAANPSSGLGVGDRAPPLTRSAASVGNAIDFDIELAEASMAEDDRVMMHHACLPLTAGDVGPGTGVNRTSGVTPYSLVHTTSGQMSSLSCNRSGLNVVPQSDGDMKSASFRTPITDSAIRHHVTSQTPATSLGDSAIRQANVQTPSAPCAGSDELGGSAGEWLRRFSNAGNMNSSRSSKGSRQRAVTWSADNSNVQPVHQMESAFEQ